MLVFYLKIFCISLIVFVVGCTKDTDKESPKETRITSRSQRVKECALEKYGVQKGPHGNKINPYLEKSFEEIWNYIAFLNRPERAAWQKPDTVVAALDLKSSDTVLDVGAGSGYFTFRIARRLETGQVIATDIMPEMTCFIEQKAKEQGLKNVKALLVKPDETGISDKVDLVFICDVLHQIPDRQSWLKSMHSKMKKGARMAIIEFSEGAPPIGPPNKNQIPKNQLIKEMAAIGFSMVSELTFLPYQYFLIFKKD